MYPLICGININGRVYSTGCQKQEKDKLIYYWIYLEFSDNDKIIPENDLKS